MSVISKRQEKSGGEPQGGMLLSVEAAAELMQCSAAYVAMLIDHNRLPGATRTEGGLRLVPESSVRTWIVRRANVAAQSDYRGAAAEAGMYDIPDQLYVEVASRRRS